HAAGNAARWALLCRPASISIHYELFYYLSIAYINRRKFVTDRTSYFAYVVFQKHIGHTIRTIIAVTVSRLHMGKWDICFCIARQTRISNLEVDMRKILVMFL